MAAQLSSSVSVLITITTLVVAAAGYPCFSGEGEVGSLPTPKGKELPPGVASPSPWPTRQLAQLDVSPIVLPLGEGFNTSSDSVSSAGDVNGDGYGDVLVGQPGFHHFAGRAFLYLGGPQGLTTPADWTTAGQAPGGRYGLPATSAGDINGDGYGDVVVGASGHDGHRGQLSLYLGSPAGLSPTPAWTAAGTSPDGLFGALVAAGDINGDGRGDLVAGAPGEVYSSGAIYLYLGTSSAPWLVYAARILGEPGRGRMYLGPHAVGDVNGDSYGDVCVYVYHPGVGEGGSDLAQLYSGEAGGLSATPTWTSPPGSGTHYQPNTCAVVGDVNGDSLGDVVVTDSGAEGRRGKIDLYYGAVAGLSSSPGWTRVGGPTHYGWGGYLSRVGDLSGDGVADLLVGIPTFSPWEEPGGLYLFQGDPLQLSHDPSWVARVKVFVDGLTSVAEGVGDVNGDGYSDLVTSLDVSAGEVQIALFLGPLPGFGGSYPGREAL